MSLPTLSPLTLVLGGACSGKSRFAEGLIATLDPPWIYLATAEAYDAEMAQRIGDHQSRRDARWVTHETPRNLAATVDTLGTQRQPILIDCLTLWLSNIMLAGEDIILGMDQLVAALARAKGPIVVVSNEVGLGIVPDNALARRFRDAQGRLNQQVAAMADQVVLVAAGLPLILKSPPRERTSTS